MKKNIKYMVYAFFISLFALQGMQNVNASSGTLLGNITSITQGGIDTVPSIMSTPLGTFIYFVLGFVIIFVIIGVVITFISFAKGHLGGSKTNNKGPTKI